MDYKYIKFIFIIISFYLQYYHIENIHLLFFFKNYENALIVSQEYSVLFIINVNYISQIYNGFKKSIFPIYQDQKKIFMNLKNIKIKFVIKK